MLRFACFITGDDYQLLKRDTPNSRKKVILLVSVLFLPVTMWFINVLLLVKGVMRCSQGTTIVSALIAACLIFMIERSIIMSNGNQKIMFFRTFLGLLIAILGSFAFDEVIFKTDIDRQMMVTKDTLIQRGQRDIETICAYELSYLEMLVSEKYNTWIQSLEKVSKEADGSGGSGVRGVHTITRLKQDIAKQNEQEYYKSQSNLEQLKQKIEGMKDKAANSVIATFNNHALLERIKAMFDLILTNNWMCFIYILVTLVLFSLEFIVVILKLTIPKSNYELKLELIEMIGRKRMTRMMEVDSASYNAISQYPAVRKCDSYIKKLSESSLFN